MTYKAHCADKMKLYDKLEKKALKERNLGANYRNMYLWQTYLDESRNPGSTTFAHMGWLDEDTYEQFPYLIKYIEVK